MLPVEVIRTGALAGKSVIAVAAGTSHSLVLCSDGTMAAWGANASGQLGNNSMSNSSVPVLVDATGVLAGTKVVAVAAGNSHNLALCANGRVAAWGSGVSGQLGEDSVENRLAPVWVNPTGVLAGKTVTAIAAGGSHSMALCADGLVATWGANDSGQLGNNSTTYGFLPAAVVTSGVLSGKSVTAVAAGNAHSLALCADGTVAAWGANESGQLGNTGTTASSVPVAVNQTAVLSGKSVAAIGAGVSLSQALCADGTMAAWGLNSYGQVGDNTVTNRTSPVAVVSTPLGTGGKFAAPPSGSARNHNLALAAVPFNNTNLTSLVVDDGSPLIATPVDSLNYGACVPHAAASVTITPTAEDADATVRVNGAVVSSGSASSPLALVLGTNTVTVQVTAPDGATIANHTLTILRPDHISVTFASASTVPVTAAGYDATGLNATFALGFAPPVGTNLTLVNNTGPARITGTFANLVQNQLVALTYNNATYRFAVNYYGGSGNDLVLQWANRKPYAWGNNFSGQLGNNSTTNRVVLTAVDGTGVLKGKAIMALAAGDAHSLALCSDGTLAAWGSNTSGQLGNNSTTSSNVPVAVTMTGALAGKTVIALAAGGTHSLALCSDGTVMAWGSSEQLGNNGGTNSSVPVAVDTSGVLSGKTVVAIGAGSTHSLALCSDGTMVTWGDGNNSGTLGNGLNSSPVPMAVTVTPALLGKTVTAVAAGWYHNLALCADGTVISWGSNSSGQLGTTSTFTAYSPVAVTTTGVLSGKTVTAIAAGGNHSVALCSDGTPVAWGYNSYGQLGNNSTTTSYAPVAVTTTGVLSGKTVVGIAAGYSHSMAWCADGTMAAWGSNASGQLGNGNITNSSVPVTVLKTSLGSGEKVTAGEKMFSAYHNLALAAAPFTNSKLAGLAVDQVVMYPPFYAGTTAYSACVSNATAAVTVRPTVDDPNASVKVNGVTVASGSSSGPVAVGLGTTAITVAVTSPDGTATTSYTISVLRPSALSATFNAASDIPLSCVSYDATGLAVNLSLGFAPPVGTNLTVIRNTGPEFITGNFTNLAQGQAVTLTYNNAVYRFVANYYGGSGNDLVLQWARNRVLAWGYNQNNQLGSGSTSTSLVPTAVYGSGVLAGKTILSLAKGDYNTLAVCSDGTVAGWGSNINSVLGNNNPATCPFPVQVSLAGALLGKSIVTIVAGDYGYQALCADGTLAVWGFDESVPVAISGTGVLAGKTVTGISGIGDHGLMLCSDGTVAAWGWNSYGQLGNNSTTDSTLPVAVDATGVLAGKMVVAVAASFDASLALCSDGTLAAWGCNSYGELGNNSTTSSSVPVAVVRTGALSGKTVTAIAAGYGHFLALCSDGTAVAWGNNFWGGLGNGGTTQSLVPVAVSRAGVLAGKTITAIDAGNGHSLAVCADGTAAAWGNNSYGQLGNNSTTNSSSPVAVPTTALASGERFVGLAATGVFANDSLAVVASPYNNTKLAGLAFGGSGPLPGFAPSVFACPASVPNSTSSVAVIPTAADPDAIVTVNGNVVTSGAASASIPIATGSNTINVQVTAPDRTTVGNYVVTVVRATAVSYTYTSAADIPVSYPAYDATGLTADLSLAFAPAIGTNLMVVQNTGPGCIAGRFSNLAQGQEVVLSYQNTSYRFLADYYGGSGNDLVLRWASAKAYAWGYDNYGQLGNNGTANSNVPVEVSAAGVLAGKTIVSVAAGNSHCLALCADGTVAAWGYNGYGQLGDGTTTNRLVPVDITQSGALAGKTVVAISTGYDHSLALCADGKLTAWGYNYNGEIGNNSTTSSSVPVAVDTTGVLLGKKVVAVAAEGSSSLALCENGTVVSWGSNIYGQLGVGTVSSSLVPVAVSTDGTLSGKTVIAVAAGSQHALALCSDGTVDAWGDNSGGQLGNNSGTNSYVPVEVSRSGVLNNRNVVAVAAGAYYSVVLCADGTVAAWGDNSSGQLGNGNTTTSKIPVAVVNTGVLAAKSVVAVAAGYNHSLALCSDGTQAAWGCNDYGQLGNNSTTSSNVPVLVNTAGWETGQRFVSTAASYQYSLAVAAVTEAPVVSSLPATNIAADSATFHGTVTPRGQATSVAFDYGLTTSYGFAVDATPSPLTGVTATNVTAFPSGLAAGTAYHFRVVATSAYGTTCGTDMIFTTNTPPVFGGYALATAYQTATGVAAADLLGAAHDVDGDPLSLTAAGPGSAQGGTAVLQGAAILYTPPAGFSGPDSFPVTIADGRGGSVGGTVTVTVGPQPDGGVFGIHAAHVATLAGGKALLTFQGVPGLVYQIQRSSDLVIWTVLATVTAGSDGAAVFTDESPSQPQAFYRLGVP